jgi:holliday junction DNA helicase RuvA
MIGSLRGKILEKNPPEILIEVNGVGYEVLMPMTSIYELPDVGIEVFIYTSFIVREDAQLLFGFTSKEARFLFRELVKVSGIGPKTALAVLSTMTPSEFVQAVRHGETINITKVPGIGKKTAERLVIDIKDKVSSWGIIEDNNPLSVPMASGLSSKQDGCASDIEEQAVNAFVALGYKPQQASLLVHKCYKEGMSVEDIIKSTLQSI